MAFTPSCKQIYRWPMMMRLPRFYKQHLPDSISNPTFNKACTGITIASFEVGILAPLERLKVYIMTNEFKRHAIRQFLEEHKGRTSFDALKTHLTKQNHMKNEKLLKALQTIYSSHGVKGLYAGWQLRMLQYVLHLAFTVSIFDRLETSWRNK